MKVKKAVIPAAGLGTRFLPITKVIPKSMLPIIDKPVLEYILEEAFDSGIEEVAIVVGHGKNVIEEYFWNWENISFIQQKSSLGLGDAILRSKIFVQDDPFAVLFGDIITCGDIPCLEQLIDVFSKTSRSVLALEELDLAHISKYNSVQFDSSNDNVLRKIDSIIEKPLENPPSFYSSIGRCIFTPEIFNVLEISPPSERGEIELTDAINSLAKSNEVYGYLYDGFHYDMGDKSDFLRAALDFSLSRSEFREKTLHLLEKTIKREP